MIFTLVAVIGGLLIFWRSWAYSFWKKNNVPGPVPTFPVGNLGGILAMKKHSGEIFRQWYNEYKDMPWIGYYKVTSPGILVRDLDLIKDILIKDFPSFQQNDIDFNNDEILSKNPFVIPGGEEWKATRAVLSPLFTLNKCKLLFPLMQPAVQRMKAYLAKNGADHVYDAKTLSSLFTTENVVKCGYSMDAGCFENPKNEFREMGKKIFQPSFLTGMKFIITLFLPIISRVLQFRFLSPEICVWLKAVLQNNLAERKKTPLPQEDLLQWLLNGMESDRIDEEEAISHAFSFFIEGFETSSGVMTLTLYALAKNKDVQTKLRKEIRQVLDDHENEFTFNALQDMLYLEAVIQETMRMFPPGLTMNKRCTKPFPMPLLPGQKTPFICPTGTAIVIPVLAIHTDPEVYPDPDTFDPERFTETERKNRHKAAYLPFGEGPRMCLGMKFAYTQIKYAVASLIVDHEVILEAPTSDLRMDPAALMFQSKENILIKFKGI